MVGKGFALISRCSVSVSGVARSATLSRFQYRCLGTVPRRLGYTAGDCEKPERALG